MLSIGSEFLLFLYLDVGRQLCTAEAMVVIASPFLDFADEIKLSFIALATGMQLKKMNKRT